MQSLQSLLDTRNVAIVQQVLRVALLFPVLERRILLSSRKGAWDRVRKGLVLFEAGGTVPMRDF